MADDGAGAVHLRHVAEKAGVSVATVSMALSNHPNLNSDTKQRIRTISREMGYRRRSPRSSGDGRRNGGRGAGVTRFGFLLLGSRMDSEVHMGELQALSSNAATAGIRMEVLAIPDISDPDQAINEMLAYAENLDGLVLSGYIDAAMLDELKTAGVAHVCLGYPMADLNDLRDAQVQVVDSNVVAMGDRATRHLLALGHRRIAFVCERLPRGLWNDRWLRGYRHALVEAGVPVDPGLIQVTGRAYAGAGPAVEAIAAMADPPTAYLAPDARMAGLLVEALRERGLEIGPNNLVVSGFQHLLARYDLQDYPWIGPNMERLGAMVIRQLRQACQEPAPCPAEVIVPFDMQNLRG